MTKDELRQLIIAEIQVQLKLVVQKSLKPLVQEAVAGALGRLLGEGIAKGPPLTASPTNTNKILRPNIPQASRVITPEPTPEPPRGNLAAARRRWAAEMGYGDVPLMGSDTAVGNVTVSKILEQTASEMLAETTTTSILESPELESITTPDVVDAVTRDYSALMNRLKERGQLHG